MKTSLAIISLSFALLSSTAANAADPTATDGSPLRVENGVLVKTGSPVAALSHNIAPEKKASEKREDFQVNPPVPEPAAKTPAAASDDMPPEDEFSPEDENIMMKPVIDKKRAAVINKNASPFKKSVYSGVNETIKRPDPKPEVSSKPLGKDDSISDDIKNLDAIKRTKDKATNAEDGVGYSGMPIPRFVSLKSGEANARTGPGDTYPIRWVYQRKNLPVEVTAEFKLWRRIKDFDGEQSWVHQALVTSRRNAILLHDASAQSDYDDGHNVARFKRGVQVRLVQCKQDACKVEYGDIQGWLKKKDLWGVYTAEVFD